MDRRFGSLSVGAACIALLVCIAACHSAAVAKESRSLAGRWRFQSDPEKQGEVDRWFERELEETIRLPGSMPENGHGNEVTVETEWTGSIIDKSWYTDEKYEPYRRADNIKVPFWLTPVKHYIGPAWYQKEISVPRKWNDKRIVLFLERCHWETHVWVDDRAMGSRNSLSTPHEYDLGVLGEGTYRLTIRVDNTVKVGVGMNAHSVSDHTQSNWNGIIGDIELRAKDAVWIRDVQVYPNVEKRGARVRVETANVSGERRGGTLLLKASSFNGGRRHKVAERRVEFSAKGKSETVEVDCDMGDAVQLWDEFAPNLYRLTASIEGDGFADEETVTFGMREIGTAATQFTLNGRKTFLRGTLECSIFPLTGYPPMDVKGWRKVLKAAKGHGLNHLRFHSWCPPEAAFVAADEMGVMFQIECAAWTNSGPTIGDGLPIDRWIYAEGDRILKAYGNHPSFCFLAYGNEPGGKNQREYLGKLVEHWKGKDGRRLYTSGAGWPIIPESEFHSTPAPRGHQWGAGLRSRFNATPLTTDFDYGDFVGRYTVPMVSHEIGQWCVYPNFDEIKKYKGVLKAKNFEIFRDSLAARGMRNQARDFLIASGKLQTILYKEEIEAALRTPGFGGFQLLDLHDFPGQGTALVGVLDPFWEYKGYVKPDEYHRFCSETVPLLRMPKCVWTDDELFAGDVEIAHFGPRPIEDTAIEWRLDYAKGRRVASGHLPARTVPVGNGNRFGQIEVDLSQVKAPAQLVLTVAVKGTDYENWWDLWVYPSQVDTSMPDDVLVTAAWDEAAIEALSQGGKVMLMPRPQGIDSDVPAGFTSIFWNTQWTGGQPPHTLGILCDPRHTALKRFPTEFHSNWQWWDLVTKSKAMILDDLGEDAKPIVQVIDDWNTNRKLGLVFEAKVGRGRLLVCSMDLRTDLQERPVAGQMLHSLLSYMGSPAFKPKHQVEAEAIENLFGEPSALERLGARVIHVDSEQAETPGSLAIDGAANTFWHTAWRDRMPDYPHEIVVELDPGVSVKGFRYLPRQDMRNGWIGDYEFYVSEDGQEWGPPVTTGRFSATSQWQTVLFDDEQAGAASPRQGRYFRLVAVSPINAAHKFAAIAELDIIAD
ncbi:MAG: discoidin domain-containing protein [Planctomycetota bacterium]